MGNRAKTLEPVSPAKLRWHYIITSDFRQDLKAGALEGEVEEIEELQDIVEEGFIWTEPGYKLTVTYQLRPAHPVSA